MIPALFRLLSLPTCAYMQGKQYSKGNGKTVNGIYYPSAEKEGVYDRLYSDYGCRHYETDIILGVSEPRYSDEELKQFEQNDKRLYKIGDIEKDGYGWSQSMRALETEIRKSKDEINALKALGGNEARIKQLHDRIKACRSKYDEISDVTGIRADMNRLRVAKPNITSGVADSAEMIIKPNLVIEGHTGTPKTAEPFNVIDHKTTDNKVDIRSFYGADGYKKMDIHTTDHGNPKQHPFGNHGEHAEDYEWDGEGKLRNKTRRNLTEQERKENRDIL